MSEHTYPGCEATPVIESAHTAADALQNLCRASVTRPSMTPAEIAAVLADLAAGAGTLPQATRQLGDILEQAKHHHALEMDGLAETEDPDLAIDNARLNRDALREPALCLYRLLEAAHNEAAHISTVDREAGRMEAAARDLTAIVHRPEDRQPPPTDRGLGSGPSW